MHMNHDAYVHAHVHVNVLYILPERMDIIDISKAGMAQVGRLNMIAWPWGQLK